MRSIESSLAVGVAEVVVVVDRLNVTGDTKLDDCDELFDITESLRPEIGWASTMSSRAGYAARIHLVHFSTIPSAWPRWNCAHSPYLARR